MNAILGMTELVLDTRLPALSVRTCASPISRLSPLLEMLNDILNFSEIEAGNLELCSEAFDVRQCVMEVHQSLRPRAAQKGLELLCDIGPGTPELVIGDVSRFAAGGWSTSWATPSSSTEQGHVALTVAPHSEGDGRESLEFSVTDTGVGIPNDKLERSSRHSIRQTTPPHAAMAAGPRPDDLLATRCA